MKHYKLLLVLIFLLLGMGTVSAQYQMALQNPVQVNSSTFQFDVYIKSTSGSINLTSYQIALAYNNAIVNGGTLGFSYSAGSSGISLSPQTTQISNDLATSTNNLVSASGVGTQTITTAWSKIGTFSITNSVAFGASLLTNLYWDFSGLIATEVNINSVNVASPSNHIIVFNPQYQMTLENGVQVNPNTFQFDVYVVSTSIDFTLTSYQIALTYNNAVVNGGTLSFAYVPSSTGLTSATPLASSAQVINDGGTSNFLVGSNSGSQTVSTTPLKVGTFSVTNTAAFGAGSLNLAWDFLGTYQTIVNINNVNSTVHANHLNIISTPNHVISGSAGIAGAILSFTDGTPKTVTADAAGAYSITVSYNWSGVVTPSLAGNTFTPVNKTYTNVLADQTAQNYTAAPATFIISGNAGIAGAVLSYTDGTAKTVTADASGNYSFSVSYNWSGTVTPALAGNTFTPANKVYTNVLANQTAQNYTAAAATFVISGNTGKAGVVLSYTDGTAKTATSDASGNYSFTVSYNWSGVVTPSLAGNTFTPANKVYTNVLADQTAQNYTAVAITYTITGSAGIAGASLSYTDGTPKTATADASGNYSFTVSYNWSGTVTPSLTGYSFTPANIAYTNVLANQATQNYTTAAITYTITGSAGIAGAVLSYTDGTAKTATADASGNYSFTVSYNWSGTVTPVLAGTTFTPANKVYTNVLANQTAQNYTAAPTTFIISGNAGKASVVLSYSDGIAKTATADASGNYSFTVSYNWSGTVTPALAGNTFTPANMVYTNTLTNQTAQNYTATPITFVISGNTGKAGVVLSYTDGTAKTATADVSGNYSFTVSYNWSGTVTPALAGNTFTPANKVYTNVLGNQTAQNYIAAPVTFIISGSAGIAGTVFSYTDGTAKTATADVSGNYSFTVSYSWSGTVTPALAGNTFTPVNMTYTNILANQTAQNYISTPITFTISGNAGTAGAILSYTDGTAKTATADASGNYSFTVSYNWSGTVTPTLAGNTFTPTNKVYTNVLADQTVQNYTATPITFAISGNAGMASVVLGYTDGTAKTVTADASGNYSFTISYNWSGTVTPVLAGHTFTPGNKIYTNVLANQTAQNYTATSNAINISGNAGKAGVVLSYTDGTAKTATADALGNYTFAVTYNWSGTVTPALAGNTFTPANKVYTNVIVDQTAQNYTATPITFTISGNTGKAGAVLSYTDGTAKTSTADASGNYSFTVSYSWSGTVTPAFAGTTFTPANMVYTNVLANQTAQNYTTAPTTFIISGNAGKAGAVLSYTDGIAKTATADAAGLYSFTVSYNWNGTVTPALAGNTFTPANKVYTNVLADQTNQNYTSAPVTLTISGNSGKAGAVLSYTDGTAKTATADAAGLYSFTVSYNWSGTVTPALAGYTFTPANKVYTNIQTDQTNQNFTSTPVIFTISGNTGIAGTVVSYTDGAAKTATADAAGLYSFTVSYNWSGTVTPALAGNTFTPANKVYTNVLADQTNQNYTASAITYTISGNAGIAGAALSYTDGIAKTATADASGNYTFTVSYNWSGIVTPALAGNTFTPANIVYTNVLANQTAQNYTAAPVTITISGSAGIAGAVLSYTDGTAKTATADASGNYTFTVSYNWSGTVTPALAGNTFTPANKVYTNVLANQTNQNYTAVPITFTISGSAGVAGAGLSYTDGTAKTATADASGNYTFTVSYNWSGTVTPTLAGHTFTPGNRVYTNVLANQTTQNYTATANAINISGNAGKAGVVLNYTDGTVKTATADASGNYTFAVTYNWSGTVTPALAGNTFTPANKVYTNVIADQAAQNYTVTPITFTISGNAGKAGVVLNYTDGTAKAATADVSGNYSFTVSYNWSGTVTPALSGNTFTPGNRIYTNVLANQTNQNYAATANAINISGNAGKAGVVLSYTDGTAKTVTADASGLYSFAVTYNWSGTVTPSLAGNIFTPANKVYTNVITDQTNQNYTATPVTYTISGNAGAVGVVLSYTDGTAKTAIADAAGLYSFTVSYNWSGTVTPSLPGSTFNPGNRIYTNVLANQTNQNYTATANAINISGNAGKAGVVLSYTDGTAKTATADAAGLYRFTVSYNWSGTVTPLLTGNTFTPASRTYTNVTTDQINQSYTAVATAITISGDAGKAGVILSYFADGTTRTVTSDPSGLYSLTVGYNWSGTVTPILPGYKFTPSHRTYTNVVVDQTTQFFTATPVTFTISGNAGKAGVVLSYIDETVKTVTSDAAGLYSFTVSYNWSGTVTPSLAGNTFTPSDRTYSDVLSEQVNQNYTATPITFAISGNAGKAGVVLSYTDGIAKTTTADASGNYSFIVSYSWSGTVTPSLISTTFSPANRAYTNISANQTNQNYLANDIITANENNTIPDKYALLQNYPNPFNPTTNIRFALPQESNVTLKIYNVLGEEVATLVDKVMPAGNQTILFNASKLASGTYIYRIQAGNFVQVKKMSLLK